MAIGAAAFLALFAAASAPSALGRDRRARLGGDLPISR
jgi:hypothetical protein